MLAIFEKLFRRRRAAATGHPAAPAASRDFYTVAAPMWRTDNRRGVYRGISGDAIALVDNLAQATTLQDTLNLAAGAKPSRRLLDAIYLEESRAAESVTRPAP